MNLKCHCRKLSAQNHMITIDICIQNVYPTDILVEKLYETGEMYDDIYFGHYYPHCSHPCSCVDTLPYLLRDCKFVWEEDIQTVTVEEFFITHNLTANDVLEIDTYEGSGGAGWEDVVELWTAIWPIIENDIYPILRVSTTALKLGNQIIKLIKLLPKQKNSCTDEQENPVLPNALFSAILSRDKWSKKELADSMGINPDLAKALLKASGYVWNSQEQKYIISDSAKEEMYRKIDPN